MVCTAPAEPALSDWLDADADAGVNDPDHDDHHHDHADHDHAATDEPAPAG